MAKQAGPLYFTGTIDHITFYKMEGQYLARKKSSLDRKRFRSDPRFARSRKSAAHFGEASKLASDIYRLLPRETKKKGRFGQLTEQVGRLLRQGKTAEEIIQHFQQQYQTGITKPATQPNKKEAASKPDQPSAWKITPTGKLIGPRLPQLLSIDRVTSFEDAAILNSYILSQRE